MGLMDKARNKLKMNRGRARQKIGRMTGNRSMRAKGMGERLSGAARQVTEQAKDAGRNLRGSVRR